MCRQKQAAYNSSKAALVHLSRSLAVEWVDFTRVNRVSPAPEIHVSTIMLGCIRTKGFIDTESKWKLSMDGVNEPMQVAFDQD